MNKVSVILPNYNHAKFLIPRLDSILNQTYQNFELIILDDCSTDNSRELLDKLKSHPKVSFIIYNKTNSGNTFKQWEKGLTLSTGSLIWIAESDDTMDSTFLSKAVSAFNENESIGIVQCGSHWISENSNNLYSDNLDIAPRLENGLNYMLKNMVGGNSIYNASAVVFKKNLIDLPVDRAICNMKYCGDWLFWINILEKANIFFLNENLNYYRRHSQSVSGKEKKNGLFYIEGIKIYYEIKKKYSNGRLFYKNDKQWAYIFSLQNFSLKQKILHFFHSFKVGILIPIFILWYSFKK